MKADDGGEILLNRQQEIDFEKVISDGKAKFDEVRGIVQSNPWARYGLVEVTTAVREAEKPCVHAYTIVVDSINHDV